MMDDNPTYGHATSTDIDRTDEVHTADLPDRAVTEPVKFAKGKVAALSIQDIGCFVRLLNAEIEPKDGWFLVDKDHANYNSIFSTILTASANRYELIIYTIDPIDPEKNRSHIRFVNIRWEE